ncbi:hypothetical protein GY45DRAFT_1311837 [Cubamyces sp. BRFM 1775]|nr:hypothetical protein GY45DRAFT_1311837 [Cubamyces sp. BRFM 1775]
MAPKPRPVRKTSTTSAKDASATPTGKDAPTPSSSMPPPPDPVPPLGILEGEITALSTCLQNAVVKTAQVYGFYADVKRLGIQKYAPHPPRSLTSALGREVQKYDQLCDAMESHLLRAIAILQRDLNREEQRLKAEEEAAAAAPKLPSPTTSTVGPSTPPGSPSQTQTETLPDGSQRPKPLVPTPARRQSTISLSSLQRPAIPHKLDLSASGLRIHPEEMIPSGLSSPVTLAPRSARTSIAPDLLAALGEAANRPVDIDLTVDGDIDMGGPSGSGGHLTSSLDPSAGSSADKPIELDLDIDMEMEFFGHDAGGGAGNANHNMFGAQPMSTSETGQNQPVKPKEEEQMDIDILKAFQGVEPSAVGDDIFASLGSAAPSGAGAVASGVPSGDTDMHKTLGADGSPATSLLASFNAVASQAGDASAVSAAVPDHDTSFVLDENFDGMDMMVDDIFNTMGVNAGANTDGNTMST